MKKTVHHHKTSVSKKPAPKGYRLIVSRLVVIITSVSVIVGLFSFVLQRTSQANACANSITCTKNMTVQIENDAVGIFEGQKVIPPKISLVEDINKTKVLGEETPSGPKHIYVDLTTQTLTAYEGEKLVMKTFVSTGRWGRTPAGEFTIWISLRSTRMSGGSGADYYNLPNVPYVMFFSNDKVSKGAGFSLHGAYWHNNFGNPMSHGCVNMRIVDAEAIYNWAGPITNGGTTYATVDNPGTPITIFGQTTI